MKKLIRKGKVKEVFQISPSELEFHFSDNVSVFGKIVPDEIPRKGETLCKTSAYWFQKTEELGIDTHYIEMTGEDTMKVESVEVIDDYGDIDKETTGYRIPLEFVSHYHVSSSLDERIQSGEIELEVLGFEEEPKKGDPLPEPYFEIFTKLEEEKEVLDVKEALSISGLTEVEFEELKEIVFDIDELMNENARKNGLIHVKGKKEFAISENDELMLIDTFGTVDEDLFWEAEEYEKGRLVQKNKDHLRQYYTENGYHDRLQEAEEEGKNEPPMPPLPDDMIEKTSKIYVDMMDRLTDGKYGGIK